VYCSHSHLVVAYLDSNSGAWHQLADEYVAVS